MLEIELVKAEEHSLWKSVIEGKGTILLGLKVLSSINGFRGDTINPFVEEDFKKKMMLERFQGNRYFIQGVNSKQMIFHRNL